MSTTSKPHTNKSTSLLWKHVNHNLQHEGDTHCFKLFASPFNPTWNWAENMFVGIASTKSVHHNHHPNSVWKHSPAAESCTKPSLTEALCKLFTVCFVSLWMKFAFLLPLKSFLWWKSRQNVYIVQQTFFTAHFGLSCSKNTGGTNVIITMAAFHLVSQ